MSKNVPEVEGAGFRTELVTDNSVFNVYCDPDEILECSDNVCALDIYNTCLADVTNVGIEQVRVDAIKFVKGGKIIIYDANNKKYCLCVHRYEISGIELCKEGMNMDSAS
ncbi:MAG: hypothetical protein QXT53_00625 [Ignisphaera sp.]